MRTVVVMSIRPIYSHAILDGRKQYEIRRGRVRMDRDDVMIIYETAPTSALVGACTVADVLLGSPDVVRRRTAERDALASSEYLAYVDGAETVSAIRVGRIVAFDRPVPLADLRGSCDFHPPRSYVFWGGPLEMLVGASAARLISALT